MPSFACVAPNFVRANHRVFNFTFTSSRVFAGVFGVIFVVLRLSAVVTLNRASVARSSRIVCAIYKFGVSGISEAKNDSTNVRTSAISGTR